MKRRALILIAIVLLLVTVDPAGSAIGETARNRLGVAVTRMRDVGYSVPLLHEDDLYLLTMDSTFDVVHYSGDPPHESNFHIHAESTVYLPPSDSPAGPRRGAGNIELKSFSGTTSQGQITCTAPGSAGVLRATGYINASSIQELRLLPNATEMLSCWVSGPTGFPITIPNLWFTSIYAMHEDEMDQAALHDGMLVQGWTMAQDGDVIAYKSYARQKAFDDGYTQQDVTENTILRIVRLPPLPEVSDIRAMGFHTPGDKPETGREVSVCVEVAPSDDYDLTTCVWNGDLPPGLGDPDCGCLYEYAPATGHGPDIDTYGDKDVSLLLMFRHKASGTMVWKGVDGHYKVFFAKHGLDHGHQGDPNWFEYWRDDGAVPGLDAPDIEYDPSVMYGRYRVSEQKIYIGAEASEVHYAPPLEVPWTIFCPGGTFGGAEGIDSVAEVLAHERRHELIDAFWEYPAQGTCSHPLGPWGGCADTDGDQMPDAYETTVLRTDPQVPDSCELDRHKGKGYGDDGDQELDCIIAGDGQQGVAENDWANPGKQADEVIVIPCSQASSAGFVRDARGLVTSGAGGLPSSPDDLAGSASARANDVARLTGQYSDVGVDSDTDGLYDRLKLSVGVQVDAEGYYKLVAWLEDGAGRAIAWASNLKALAAGPHTLDLLFDGGLIWNSGADGPYRVALVELRSGEHEDTLDFAEDVHATAAHAYTDFDPPGATFNGLFTDVTQPQPAVTSPMGDLRIRVGVDVHSAGRYALEGILTAEGEVIAVDRLIINRPPGFHDALMEFPREAIYNHRADGPFVLRTLRLSSVEGDLLDYASHAFTTTVPYTYPQFLYGEMLIDDSSLTEEAIDLDQDELYDSLDVTFLASTESYTACRASGVLEDAGGQVIARSVCYPTGYLQGQPVTPLGAVASESAAESRVVTGTLSFSGELIHNHGVDGPYKLTALALVSMDGTPTDYLPVACTTDAYRYADFFSSATPTPTATVTAVTPGPSATPTATVAAVTPGPSATPTATANPITPRPSATPTSTPRGPSVARLHLPMVTR